MNYVLHVNVTQEDIDSNKHACFNCPHQRAIERALREVSKRAISVLVGNTFLTLGTPSGVSTCGLPEAVSQWIAEYDGYHLVEPISYILQVEIPA